MTFLQEDDRQRIAAAVRQAELGTRGELVTVIAAQSDHYILVPWFYASVSALLWPALMLLLGHTVSLAAAYLGQVTVFMVVLLTLQWPQFKMALVPAAMKRSQARRMAREQFFAQGLHRTRERTGVLIFVSAAERYVEILADAGIDAQMPEGAWDDLVARFVAQLKAGNTVDGFVEIVAACGEALAQHFPPRADDSNELPDSPVEI